MTNYKQAKDKLRSHAEWVKVFHNSDLPAIRQEINDYADMLSKEYALSDRENNWFFNYAVKLHP